MITIIVFATGATFMPNEKRERTIFFSFMSVFAIGAYTTVFFVGRLIRIFIKEREFLAKSFQEYIQ